MKIIFFYRILTLFILLNHLFETDNYAQKSSSTYISKEIFEENSRFRLRSNWKFMGGDDFSLKDTAISDRGWISVDTELRDTTLDKINWEGIGWFRLKVDIDTSFLNKPLGITLFQTGTAEVYLNGMNLFRTGKITGDPRDINSIREYPSALVFTKIKNNIIAVRYSNYNLEIENEAGLMAGFTVEIGNLSKMISETSEYLHANLLSKIVFIVAPLVLALFHLFLFIFNPKLRQDLYYTIFLIFFAIYIYFGYGSIYTLSVDDLLIYREFTVLGLNLTLLFGSATIYSLYKPLPKYFYIFILIAIIISIAAFFSLGVLIWYMTYTFIVGVSIWGSFPLFDSKYKKEGELIIKTGFVIMTLTGAYQILLSLGIAPPVFGITDLFTLGVLAFMVFMSVSLAYEFTLANRKLEKQLAEINTLSERTLQQELEAKDLETQKRILQIENERKSKEIEEARKLQLSMLPEKIPQLPEYDIAVFMKTATEVGGDYYDFRVTKEGTLNVVLGDATGHGMKAGLMVASVKSLFTSIGLNLTLTDFFEKCTVTIKDMNLGNLFMSLALLKLKNDKVLFSSAGMPPFYHYIAEQEKLNKIIIKSMPLGAVKKFPYEIQTLDLNRGDFLVLMSDGLPERFNAERKMLGYDMIAGKIKEISKDENAEGIIRGLFELSEHWSGGRILDDDLSLVVIKKIK